MTRFYLPLILALAFFIIQLFTLKDYGMNWDSPFRFMRGQAYLELFLHQKLTYNLPKAKLTPVFIHPGESITRYSFNEWEGENPLTISGRPLLQNQHAFGLSFYQSEDWNGEYFIKNDGPGHPPLIDILAALSNRIFYQFLHIIDDIHSYHLPIILIASLGVFLTTYFCYQITNSYFAALIAGLVLIFSPSFFAESHLNLKDPVQASFYIGAVYAFWRWVSTNRWRYFYILVLFTTLAMGVKWNILLLLPILAVWLAVICRSDQFQRWFSFKKVLIGSLAAVLVIFSFLTLIWPYLWNSPIEKLLGVFHFYRDITSGDAKIQPEGFLLPLGFNPYPILLYLFQCPEIILLLLIAALFFRPKKKDLSIHLLLWLILIIPVVRMFLPGARYYGGVRQAMEVIPARAILAGLGSVVMIKYLQKIIPIKLKYLQGMLLSLITTLLIFPIIHFYPLQSLYFNQLIGGIQGAEKYNLIDWGLTYGSSFKLGVDWLNQNGIKDSNLALVSGTMFAIPPIWLREDISISPNHFSGFDQKGEYLLYRYNKTKNDFFAFHYPRNFLRPIHEVKIDGVTILSIYKNDPDKRLVNTKREVMTDKFITRPVPYQGGFYLEIDLGQEVALTKILLSNVPSHCLLVNSHYNDEVIWLVKEGDSKKPLDLNDTFLVNEYNKVADKEAELLFPGSQARYIRILPVTRSSCFRGGVISKIGYIQ